LSEDEKQAWGYLQDVVQDYARYLSDIHNLGLTAPNVLYYRDEIQDMLEEFKGDPRVDFRGVWLQVKELDEILRANQDLLVKTIGHANFKQYHIMNDPPRTHWWWFLNRVVAPPPPQPAWWQFWKKPDKPLSEPEEASSGQEGGDGLGVGEPPVQGHS
jgi:hypothetical protein